MINIQAKLLLVGVLSLSFANPALARASNNLIANSAELRAQAGSPSPSTLLAQAGSSSGDSGQGGEPSRNQAIYEMAYKTLLQENVPGYAIAIVKDGNPVFRSTFGMADVVANKKVSKNTIFGLASLTKTFTGLALMQLIEEGKIKPGDTLDLHLKDLPPAWKKLTIFQLASMQAGLPESRADELLWPEEMDYLKKQPLAYQPGSRHVYSNDSFRVLGSVIESVTGMPYLDYITKAILQPLGMNSTGTTETMAATGRVSQQYVGHELGPPSQIQPKNPMTSFSAGMLASSLDDMCTFAGALLDKRILSERAYKMYLVDRPAMADGKPNNWAWGWASTVNKRLGVRVIAMNGGLPGVASSVILVPEQRMAVVALSNMRTKPVYTIARRAMNIFLTGDDLAPQPAQDTPGQNSDTSGQGMASSGRSMDTASQSSQNDGN